jgi:hypothetical protein
MGASQGAQGVTIVFFRPPKWHLLNNKKEIVEEQRKLNNIFFIGCPDRTITFTTYIKYKNKTLFTKQKKNNETTEHGECDQFDRSLIKI